jgi:hypothetical protein
LRLNDALIAALLIAPAAAAQQPLSAIDWLDGPASVSVAAPRVEPLGLAPQASGVDTPTVSVMALDAARSDSVGLLPATVTGLPVTLWQASSEAAIVGLLERLSPEPLPAIQALYYTLLLAEAEAPGDAGSDGLFLKARVAALQGYGATDPALALIERAGPATPALFDTWLDLALLAGTETEACAALAERPALSDDYGAQVFCIAQTGDWQTAALIYESAVGLGLLSATQEALLAQFLDPEMVEGSLALAPISGITPLLFRLYEAVGQPLPTQGLPRAYASADLRPSAGLKARLEAAERLAHAGALPANRLLGLYTERSPAASGGVWDRARIIQSFDQAMFRQNPEPIARILPDAWQAMRDQGLGVAFAELYGAALAGIALPPRAQSLAFRIGLLSPEYESIATAARPLDETERFLAGLARGTPPAELADSALKQAIARAFAAGAASGDYAALLESGKLGQAILSAGLQLDRAGLRGFEDITSALATLRAVGLEETARRAALELLILESGA